MASLREVFLIKPQQKEKKLHCFKMKAFWLFQEMEHLAGVCEQQAATCLMATWARFVPETGWCAWLRGASGSAILDYAEQAGTTVYILVIVQLKFQIGRANRWYRITPNKGAAEVFKKCLSFEEVLLDSKELQIYNRTDSDIKKSVG